MRWKALLILCVRWSSVITVVCTISADNIVHSGSPAPVRILAAESEYTVMSVKRKLNLLVTDKHVEGWDDPRMPIHFRSALPRLYRGFYSEFSQTHRRHQLRIPPLRWRRWNPAFAKI